MQEDKEEVQEEVKPEEDKSSIDFNKLSDSEKMGVLIGQYIGHDVKDNLTGFQGKTIQVIFSLTGIPKLEVQPMLKDSGEMQKSHWFDITRLQYLPKEMSVDVKEDSNQEIKDLKQESQDIKEILDAKIATIG